VKSRSEISELLKKVHEGGYPGIPTVKALTHPPQLLSYIGIVHHAPVFVIP
jgi:hypothetical protein